MKRLLLATACSLFIITASAQIQAGEKMIGGDISFTTGKDETSGFFTPIKTTSFTIAPQFGYGLPGNWIVGLGAGYGMQTMKATSSSGNDSQKQTAGVFSVGVFARKFLAFNDKAGVYGQLDLATGFGKQKQTVSQTGGSSFTQEADVNNMTAMLKPGFYFKLNNKIIFETSFGGLGYTSTTYKPDGSEKATKSEFSFTLTSSVSVGFQIAWK